MKHFKVLTMMFLLSFFVAACGTGDSSQNEEPNGLNGEVAILLSDDGIKVNGEAVSEEEAVPVYIGNDIVYYEDGKDFTYGEGSEDDAHSAAEASAHTVVHITQPGTYSISGKLSLGQIAVDLGKEAKENPEAVVTLVLNGVDITCKVAPAVIFYNVYECGSTDTETATKDVDTTAAGANVMIADDTENKIHGSYVARIYKPDSVVLNKDKTEVEDAKKLHKYDAAFYSKMSMNMNGGEKGTGVLDIQAENEGLDSELHLTINGGNIRIRSGNDGINTNEDGVSVTTVNGGTLNIQVTGETGEGDGIDSNGWLVINGGTVTAAACSNSADAGIDSDRGIYILGGTVIAAGHMLDKIEDNGQTYAVFQYVQEQDGKAAAIMKNEEGTSIMEYVPGNSYSILVYSSPEISEGTYTLWSGEKQLAGKSGSVMGGMPGGMGMPGGNRPGGFPGGQMPEGFQDGKMPEGFQDGQMPEGFQNGKMPEGFPDGQMPNDFQTDEDLSTEFKIVAGSNMFSGITWYN